jgi:hypothetical protein
LSLNKTQHPIIIDLSALFSLQSMHLRSGRTSKDTVPSSFHVQYNVLTKKQIADLMPALDNSDYSHSISSAEGGLSVDDWGVRFTADNMPVHPALSRAAKIIVSRDSYIKSLSPGGRPTINRILAVQMDSDPPNPSRNRFQPQHHWHKDGTDPTLSLVYTLYNGEWDSDNSPGALECGGRVAISDRPCGTTVYAGHDFQKSKVARSGRVLTYYPRTNGLYFIPGNLVSHAVFRMEVPNVTRYAVVIFLQPRELFLFQSLTLPADEYLRLVWALGFCKSTADPIFCKVCYRVFDNRRQIYDHHRRQPACLENRDKKRASEDLS